MQTGEIRQILGFWRSGRNLKPLKTTPLIALSGFSLTVKTAFRGSRRTIAKRFHLTKCIEFVGYVVDYQNNMARYNDYVNAAKILKLHRFPIPEVSNVLGRTLTDFATRIFRAQCTLLTKEKYTIAVTLENGWSVTNNGTERIYEAR